MSAIPIADPDVEQKRQRILLSGDVPSPVNLGEGCSFCKRCSRAGEQCRRQSPPLREVSPGHMAACHFAEGAEG